MEIKYAAIIVVVAIVVSGGVLVIAIEDDDGLDMLALFKENEVIPDVEPECLEFLSVVCVTYADGSEVLGGNNLTPSQAKEMPEFYWDADPDRYYTVVMVDPDAPSRNEPTYREYRHMVVINALGGDIESGEDYTPYLGPAPPKGTGPHRYVFLVYEQPDKLDIKESDLPVSNTTNRRNWSAAGFAHDYGLGNPCFGNFFFSEFEEPGNNVTVSNDDC